MPPPVTLARQAMATRFEIVIHGDNPVFLRAAGEEAFDEIERLEARLSLYQPTSEIARVNARAAREPVRVSPATFRLLEHAARLSAETEGAFDITIGPLMKCWGFTSGSGELPSAEAVAEARARVGMHLVELDATNFTVRFARDGVMLDLGAIGKGHAVGVAAEILREAGVTRALIHGGTSSVYALGTPPDAEAWKVAIERPLPPLAREGRAGCPHPAGSDDGSTEPSRRGEDTAPYPARMSGASETTGDAADSLSEPPLLTVIHLRDAALGVSAVWGKSFQSADKTFGHVLDPRTGQPVERAVLAAVALPDATEADALSTALLTLGAAGFDLLAHLRPAARALVLARDGESFRAEVRGLELA